MGAGFSAAGLAAICAGPRLVGPYVLHLFTAAYESLREAGRGGNQAALNCEIVRDMRIPVPPIAEQREIIDILHAELNRLEALSDEARHAMQLLAERRSSLVLAAVTGQIDVRELAPAEIA